METTLIGHIGMIQKSKYIDASVINLDQLNQDIERLYELPVQCLSNHSLILSFDHQMGAGIRIKNQEIKIKMKNSKISKVKENYIAQSQFIHLKGLDSISFEALNQHLKILTFFKANKRESLILDFIKTFFILETNLKINNDIEFISELLQNKIILNGRPIKAQLFLGPQRNLNSFFSDLEYKFRMLNVFRNLTHKILS